MAARRITYMRKGATAEYVQALRDVVVAFMIEKRSAVEQLDEILYVPGIDMVQWGPADYCMSIGKPGARNSPEVTAAERHVIETCLRRGIVPRAEIQSSAEAQYYLDMGVRHFCMGSELNILYDWLVDQGGGLRTAITAGKAVPAR